MLTKLAGTPKSACGRFIQLLVPGAGVEPALSFDNEILSLACLPISPPGHRARSLLMSVQLLNVKCYKVVSFDQIGEIRSPSVANF